MLVSASSLAGTIGGGRLEWDAVDAARTMLAKCEQLREATVSLGPAIGQCCGGRVTMRFDLLNPALLAELTQEEAAMLARQPSVLIYGAGHVGCALARTLAPLPLHVSLIDSRPDELARAQETGVALITSETPVTLAETAPAGAAHVVMTHSHALDSLIASAVLERGDFAYLGLIGSATKRAAFLSAFRATGFSEEQLSRLTCPIGGSTVSDKRPEVIAALTAAEILAAVLKPDQG